MTPTGSLELVLDRTDQGVCPIVVIFFGRRGVGKTRAMQAFASLAAERPKLIIVSPIQTLKARMPDLPWYQISVSDKAGMEKLFRGWLKDGVQRFVLVDEGDELTAANAAGTAGGFVVQAVYDYINYGREQGLGIAISTRRPANIARDVTANANLVFVGHTADHSSLRYFAEWMKDPRHPEVDYQEIVTSLPTLDQGYPWNVFMVWEPGRKFLGYATVEMNSGELRPWDPSELEGQEIPEEDRPVLDASDTDPSTTTDTNGSERTSGTGASAAGSAAESSPTGRDRRTASTTGGSPGTPA